MTKEEMLAKVIPLVTSDPASLRDALEVAWNSGMSAGLSEARGMLAAQPSGAAKEPSDG